MRLNDGDEVVSLTLVDKADGDPEADIPAPESQIELVAEKIEAKLNSKNPKK